MISKKLTRLDIFLIVAVLTAAVLLLALKLLPTEEKKYLLEKYLLVISDNAEQSFSLDSDRDIELFSNGIRVKITIEDGSAFIADSECRNGICMRSPRAKSIGDSIVCAPAGIALIIEGSGGGADADAYAG